MEWIGGDEFAVLAGSYLLIIGWCALVTESTVSVSGNGKRRLAGWSFFYAAALVGGVLLEAVMLFLDSWESTLGPLSGPAFVSIAVSFILLNFMEIMLPLLAAMAGGLSLYGGHSAAQQFMAVFTGIWAVIVNEFLFPTALMPFLGAVNGRYREMPSPWITEGIRLIVFALAFWCYRRFFCESFKRLLSEGKECLGHFIKVMVVALALFVLLTAILPTYRVSSLSADMQTRSFWIGAMGMTVGINGILYWAFFTAIEVSAREMKTRADLEVATRIQSSVLPKGELTESGDSGFSVRGDMVPAREVGGDFYDYFFHEDGRLVAVIGDVSGKGVPAALFMMSAMTLLRAWGKQLADPGQVLRTVNHELAENNEEGMFVTAFLCMYDRKTGVLTYSNAGHNPPYVCKKAAEPVRLPVKPGFVLAYMENFSYETQRYELTAGEKLALYTDGITEAMDGKGELFGEERLIEVLKSAGAETSEECIRSLKREVKQFSGETPQSDDITVVLLERNEGTDPCEKNKFERRI